MKIKRYQAPTMREALEQVKQDLGEEALVLDTKKIHTRSFFGRGKREMIEVKVAADSGAKTRETKPKKNDKHDHKFTTLNLTDDAPATPEATDALGPRHERISTPVFAALAARAANASGASISSNELAEKIAALSPLLAANPDDNRTSVMRSSSGVELADTPPRVVHRPNATKPQNSQTPPQQIAQLETLTRGRDAVSVELERLRLELREVKFSINSLAARPAQISEAASAIEDSYENDPQLYPSPFYEAYSELIAAGLSTDYAHRAVRAAILSGSRDDVADPLEVARFGLRQALPAITSFADDPLALRPDNTPAYHAVVFVGPTGVGKTTTIAKLAARLALREKRRVELITLDTYRIAAVEQLKTYAEIIGTRCHIARSVVEVDALTRRYAGEAALLIDTVGRSPHDLADQMELADYLRASEILAKCLVLQATTNAADALAAVRKFALYGATHLALTKLDETARPATTLSVAADANLPLAYLCHGQRVPEDIERATPENYAARMIRAGVHIG